MTAPDDRARDGLLREAEAWIRLRACADDRHARLNAVLMAEYDERGRELERLREQQSTAVRAWATVHAEDRAELERLRTAMRAYVDAPEFDQELFDRLEVLTARPAPPEPNNP